MNKKAYIKPSIIVVELKNKPQLFAGSPGVPTNDEPGYPGQY